MSVDKYRACLSGPFGCGRFITSELVPVRVVAKASQGPVLIRIQEDA